MKRVATVLMAIVLSGCGADPKIDATNEETATASLKAVGDSLSAQDKAKLSMKLAGAAMSTGVKKFGLTKGGKMTALDMAKPFHGMTGSEVLAGAKAK